MSLKRDESSADDAGEHDNAETVSQENPALGNLLHPSFAMFPMYDSHGQPITTSDAEQKSYERFIGNAAYTPTYPTRVKTEGTVVKKRRSKSHGRER